MAADDQGKSPEERDGGHIPGAPYSPSESSLLAGLLELGARAVSADRVALWVVRPPAGEGGRVTGEGEAPAPPREVGGRLLHRIHLYHAIAGHHTAGGLLPEERFPRYFEALDADDLLVVDHVSSDPRTEELVEPYARPLGIQAWIDQQVLMADGRRALVRYERTRSAGRWSPEGVGMARAMAAAVRALPEISDPAAPMESASSRVPAEARPPPAEGEVSDSAYQRLLEHSRVGMVRLAPDGTVLQCNPGFSSLLEVGYPEAVVGRSVREFVHDEATADQLLNRLRDLDSLPPEEVRLRTDQGQEAWALITAVSSAGGEEHLALVIDVTARKERERTLERQAHFDALTGLPNRRLLWQQATRLLALADRYERKAAVAYLDLCDFKGINDRFGHVTGDRVLSTVAARLASVLRDSDVGARIGGDEFAALLSEVDGVEGAREAGRRILEALNDPVSVSGQEIEVRTRAGLALYPDHGGSLDELLVRADQAMYVARASDGETDLEVFQRSDEPESPRPDRTTRDLQRAVDDDEFILHYQPIVGLPRGEFSGVEALIRWRHPAHGLLAPAAFLSDALQAGLLVEIDRWVLRRAVGQAAHWKRRGGPEWVSVNLAIASLRDPGLAHFIQDELRRSELEPHRLVLEVAEPDVREEGESALRSLAEIRELGVHLAVDCREMGSEVRSSLRTLEPDLVKVDLEAFRAAAREETADGEPGPGPEMDSEEMEAALSEFLGEPKAPLLLERVETEGDFARARRSVFTLAQGYYMSRPAPASEIRFPGEDNPGAEESSNPGEGAGSAGSDSHNPLRHSNPSGGGNDPPTNDLSLAAGHPAPDDGG